MSYTLKPINKMDEDHLINTVNKVSMDIERRRECLLELRKRFDKDYTYTCGSVSIHTHLPSKRVYDGRMFEDDWYTSGKAEFYGASNANWKCNFIPNFTNSFWELEVGDIVTLKNRSNEYDVYTKAQEDAMGHKHTVTKISEYSFTLDITGYIPWVYADISRVEKQKQIKPKRNTKMKSAISTQLDSNKQAAVLAAEITAGKVLNNKVVTLLKPKMPMIIRGYIDSPLASVALANVVGVVLKQYAPDNAKAAKVADLMLNASALQLMESFNIEALLDELLAGIKLPETNEKEI